MIFFGQNADEAAQEERLISANALADSRMISWTVSVRSSFGAGAPGPPACQSIGCALLPRDASLWCRCCGFSSWLEGTMTFDEACVPAVSQAVAALLRGTARAATRSARVAAAQLGLQHNRLASRPQHLRMRLVTHGDLHVEQCDALGGGDVRQHVAHVATAQAARLNNAAPSVRPEDMRRADSDAPRLVQPRGHVADARAVEHRALDFPRLRVRPEEASARVAQVDGQPRRINQPSHNVAHLAVRELTALDAPPARPKDPAEALRGRLPRRLFGAPRGGAAWPQVHRNAPRACRTPRVAPALRDDAHVIAREGGAADRRVPRGAPHDRVRARVDGKAKWMVLPPLANDDAIHLAPVDATARDGTLAPIGPVDGLGLRVDGKAHRRSQPRLEGTRSLELRRFSGEDPT
eukprot:CAMPEP_0195649944 /NCGR_PEP_ID=MMETSP0815-20121206/31458_1 /TAXON_ID=97485 /ORGANISM="Prymnesium parvum, Strain Texoma1" /LENGTH=407 /DNA_ID=CAMNT_0040793725 /DNA_START=338 /DNA_END=1563 /DNA_ORIENTATION=-